jgi:hypothetical protein
VRPALVGHARVACLLNSGDTSGRDPEARYVREHILRSPVGPRADVAVTPLADLLFVEVLGTYFSAPGTRKSALSAAPRDPSIAAAAMISRRDSGAALPTF